MSKVMATMKIPNNYFSKKSCTQLPKFYCDEQYEYIISKDNNKKQK